LQKLIMPSLRRGDLFLMASDDLLSLGSGIDAGNAISLMLACESEREIQA
jgi:hypothetical protein